MPSLLSVAQTLSIWALPVLFAITLHEVAHGWAARALGDDTAARAGRLSLNPIKHIDPIGTILVPAVLLVLGGFLFGWAKPVPVLMSKLPRPRRDMALVAMAGPLSNLIMAVLWGLLLKVALAQDAESVMWIGLRLMASAGVIINLVLMVLNLLPVPPLDGGRVLNGLLPEAYARKVDRLEPYGLVILVVLMATGVLAAVLRPPLTLAQGLIADVLNLAPNVL